MEIFVERENDLSLSWNPGCLFEGIKQGEPNYQTFMWGYAGCSGVRPDGTSIETDYSRPYVRTDIPDAIQFSIGFKESDMDLYKLILHVVTELKNNGDEIKINYRTRLIRKNIKDEFMDKVKMIENRNSLQKEKFDQICSKLDEIGVNYDDLNPGYESIPDEYYEHTEIPSSISVCCHDKTEFYQFLKTNGLLDKYYPESFRKAYHTKITYH